MDLNQNHMLLILKVKEFVSRHLGNSEDEKPWIDLFIDFPLFLTTAISEHIGNHYYGYFIFIYCY